MRLNQIARKIDVSTETIVGFFQKKGIEIKHSPNTKLTKEQMAMLLGGMPEAKKMNVDGDGVAKKDTLVTGREPSLEKVKQGEAVENVEVVVPRLEVKEHIILKNKPEVKGQGDEKVESAEGSRGVSGGEKLGGVIPTGIEGLQAIKPIASVKVYAKREVASKPRKRIIREVAPAVAGPQQKSHPAKQGRTYPSRSFPRRYGAGGGRSHFRKKRKKRGAGVMTGQGVEAIRVTEFVSTEALGLLLGVGLDEIMKVCVDLGFEVSRNQRLESSIIALIAEALDKEIELVHLNGGGDAADIASSEDGDGVARAPIVVVMGHVDHGKTSLLDYLRRTKLVASERGGITQHIGAYQIEVGGRVMTFLDTPGHKAFTAMRARGTKVADVAIVIIAADDGVMPQTQEAIRHAQLGGVPIVFAFNKMDKPGVNVDRVKQQLADMSIMVEDWGGKFQCENISAQTGLGIDDLLEKVFLEADVLELKADPTRLASGTVIESSLVKGRGYVVTVIGQEGTLRVGDVMVAGSFFGKVKALSTGGDERIKTCVPSLPVQVLGFNGAPQAGEIFKVVETEQAARALAEGRRSLVKEQELRAQHGGALQRMQEEFEEGSRDYFNIIIKGDTDGSIEALADVLADMGREDARVRIVYRGVGPISESDVLLAVSSKALVLGFHTKMDRQGQKVAERYKVKVVVCHVIYEAIEAVEKVLNPTVLSFEEVFVGSADVVKVFEVSRVGTIAGCIVQKGSIKKGMSLRILRNGEAIYTGSMRQLKREKEVIKEAKKGTECGISMANFNDIKVGDVIECFEQKAVQ